MVQSLDHVLFKLLLRDSLSLLVEHAFIAHVLKSVYRRKQTGPDLNFDVGVGLGLVVQVDGWLFVNGKRHHSFDDALKNSPSPHDHQITMARVLRNGVSPITV